MFIFVDWTDASNQKPLSDLVMPDTDSSSEESSTGMNARFNNMAMPETDSELSEEDTPHAIAPSRPNHQLNTLVMPDTDSNSSDNGTDGSDTEDEQNFDQSLVMPQTDSQSDSSVTSEGSAHSEPDLSQSVDPNRQFGDIESMSGSE